MANASNARLRTPLWLSLLVAALCLICVGIVRFYPYELAFPSFPRVTHTHTGSAGDPLNLVFIGSRDQISGSFLRAGWLAPDPITAQTSAAIAAASVAHRAYPTAPVSNLYAFGRAQDLAFEKPTNDVQYRGHIRLWQTEMTLDGQPVWIAQASYDDGIELSASNELPTHHIAPAVDRERNAVGADLLRTGLTTEEHEVAYATPIIYARNGGGDFYESDGDALIINLTHASLPLPPQSGIVDGLKLAVFVAYDVIVTAGAPVLLVAALALAAIIGVTAYRSPKRKRAYGHT